MQFDTLLPHRLGTAAKPPDHSRLLDGNGYKRSGNLVLKSWQRGCTCLTIAASCSFKMISFSNINKQYGKQLLFVDASFQLNPGEKVGLVGPNGAGYC